MDMEHPLQYEEGVATTLQEMDWNVVETNKKHTRVVLLAACLFCGGFGFGTELGQGGEAYFTQEEGDPLSTSLSHERAHRAWKTTLSRRPYIRRLRRTFPYDSRPTP